MLRWYVDVLIGGGWMCAWLSTLLLSSQAGCQGWLYLRIIRGMSPLA